MRKNYFTLAAALLALSTTTTAQKSEKPLLYTTLQQANAEVAKANVPQNVLNKNMRLTFPKVAFSSSRTTLPTGVRRAEEDTPTIIKDQPEGTLHKNWYQYTEGWTSFMGFYIYNVYTDGGAIDWVDGSDGNVYVKNLIGTFYSNAWLKGEKAQGDTVVFNLPQTIYAEEYSGETEYYNLWRYKYSAEDNWYLVDDSVQTVKFVLRDDSLVFAESDDINNMIGLGTTDGDWVGYGDYLVSLKKFDQPTVAPAAPAAAEGALMTFASSTEDGKDYQTMKVAIEGDDIYLGALTDNQPNAWAKGKIEGNKAIFEGNQYLGVDTVTEAHMFFMTCGHDSVYNAEYDYTYDSAYAVKQIVFDYDPVAKTLKNDELGVAVSKGNKDLNAQAEYYEPSIAPWTEKAGTPITPTIYDFMAYDVDYGCGGIQFYLNRLSTDSLYLPAEHLYYKVYLDEDEFTFDTETYTSLDEPLVEVPYLYSDGSDIQYYGDNHIFYFYVAGFDKMGIQEIYNDGTTKLYSDIVWQSVESDDDVTAVKGIEAKGADVKSVKYCDLSGRAVSKISHGLYIKTTTLADGTVITKKVMVK